jgi:hypothetical protein
MTVKVTTSKLVVLTFGSAALAATYVTGVSSGVLDARPDPVLAESWSAVVPLRLVSKELIARDVAAGRLSLFAAAAMFRALDQLPPQGFDLARLDDLGHDPAIPADTADERFCRSVLSHVRVALSNTATETADAIVTRLTAEYVAERNSQGAIRLSDQDGAAVNDLLERAQRVLN